MPFYQTHSCAWSAAYLQVAVMLLVFGLGLPGLMIQLAVPEEFRAVYWRRRLATIPIASAFLLVLATGLLLLFWHVPEGSAALNRHHKFLPGFVTLVGLGAAVAAWVSVMATATSGSILRRLQKDSCEEIARLLAVRRRKAGTAWMLLSATRGRNRRRAYAALSRALRLAPATRRRMVRAIGRLTKLYDTARARHRVPVSAVDELMEVASRSDSGMEKSASLNTLADVFEFTARHPLYDGSVLYEKLPKMLSVDCGEPGRDGNEENYKAIIGALTRTLVAVAEWRRHKLAHARLFEFRTDHLSTDFKVTIDTLKTILLRAVNHGHTRIADEALSTLVLCLPESARATAEVGAALAERQEYPLAIQALRSLTTLCPREAADAQTSEALALLAASIVSSHECGAAWRIVIEELRSTFPDNSSIIALLDAARLSLENGLKLGLADRVARLSHKVLEEQTACPGGAQP